MNPEQLLVEIRDANLTYLMLAQNLIRTDRAEALFRLGLSQDAADMIDALSPSQVLKTASTNMLLCRFRVDDDLVWNLLTNHGLDEAPSRTNSAANAKVSAKADIRCDQGSASRMHASILMAGRFSEVL